jgi:protein-disulfide isomerase
VSPKKKTQAKGTGFRGYYLLLGAVAVAGVAAIGFAIRGDKGTTATAPVMVQGVEEAGALVARAEGITLGNPDAPVTMIVFSDYQCPGCAQFASRIKPFLEANEVKSGKLKMVYYDLPLTSIHQHSFLAARAARCAGDQGNYWEYSDQLFGNQNAWAFKRSAPLKEFKDYASAIGLDQAAFETCLQSDSFAETVTANALLAQRLGVNGTPTVIINNRRVADAFRYEALSALIAEESGN